MDPHVTSVCPKLARGRCCSLCGGGGRTITDDPERRGELERWIDTMMHVEQEGFIAICETCIRQMAHLLGFITPLEARARDAEIERLVAGLDDACNQIVALQGQVDARDAILGYHFPGEDPAATVTSADESAGDGEVVVDSGAEGSPARDEPSPSLAGGEPEPDATDVHDVRADQLPDPPATSPDDTPPPQEVTRSPNARRFSAKSKVPAK